MSTVVNPVGPEEPATYWRRRLLVGLGVLVGLIVVFLVLRSCGAEATPTAAPSESASPSPSASASSANPTSTAVTGLPCADTDIEVTVEPTDGTTYSAGTPITFLMSIKNVSDTACDRNVGTKPNTVLVESGSERVWSSDDCAASAQDDVKSINPGDVYQLNATWDQQLSAPGCPAGQPEASAGSYDVVGINGDVESEPVTFTIG